MKIQQEKKSYVYVLYLMTVSEGIMMKQTCTAQDSSQRRGGGAERGGETDVRNVGTLRTDDYLEDSQQLLFIPW